ncbi:hypothetical protein EH223_16360 [candidate division KSB1 bacterium]|nr:hypothetical protein [candidate division KSB1 bacterium]RQW01099.1 MAG: hypothetical protein EH223_16360 [candidate division KSB1 bacterium]
MKRILLLFVFLLVLPCQQYAKATFSRPSTWTQKIPAHPEIMANSDQVIQSIIRSGKFLSGYNPNLPKPGIWSVPVWYATENDAKQDIQFKISGNTFRQVIADSNWNRNVPIPPEAKPAAYGEDDYYDRHMVVVSHDKRYAWDFYQAILHADGRISCNIMNRWDLLRDGINQPEQFMCCRVAPVPLIAGLVFYEEVVQDRAIHHALAFATSWLDGEQVYPCISAQGYDGLYGYRLQLDPDVDISSLGLNWAGEIIAKALQDYGMIYVENNGGGNKIYIESLDDKSESWSGILDSFNGKIPLSAFRVVKPVYVDESKDTTPPSPPKNVRAFFYR